MGKKSKRNRSSSSLNHHGGSNKSQSQLPPPRQRRLDDIDEDDDDDDEEVQRRMVHPSLRTSEEETKDNLRFQDPFIEEYCDDGEEEEEGDWEDDDDDDDDDEEKDDDEVVAMKSNSTSRKRDKSKLRDTEDSEMEEVVQTWNPFSKEHQNLRQLQNEVLEMDPTAYKMYHAMQNEWPSLSFDFIYDTYGIARTKFPHTMLLVCGTQAEGGPQHNQLTVMKISDLHRIHIDTDDDILGEEIKNDDDNDDDDNDNDDDDDDDDDDVDDEEVEPVMEHYTIQHYGGVNRLRVMKQHYNSNIVASWSDVGTVNLYNIQNIRQRFLEPDHKVTTTTTNTLNATSAFYSYNNEETGVEGFALDWSPIVAGRLATGDCHGSIHLWTPTSNDGGSTYNVSYLYNNVASANNHSRHSTSSSPINSVEDVQWSPTEATVLAAASCDGSVRIFDIRKPGQAMIGHHIHDADVNVLSWNPLVTNLLATGGDDGTLAVWDLRHFTNRNVAPNAGAGAIQPLARFTPHTTPITSVEWHPTDESMLVASDDVGTYIYDLSVEEDDTTATANLQQQQQQLATFANNNNNNVVVPPQLLFVHNGSEQFKEVHWHPQITSCVMTTALTGFSIFIPSNL
jgi:ribosome assembly protein RRB1